MKMTRAILVAVALSCFGVGGAHAFDNGNELHESCQRPESPASRGLCSGYIVGVADTLKNLGAFCWPRGSTRGQVTDVVTLYLRDHPEKRHLPAYELVTAALKEKFPCS